MSLWPRRICLQIQPRDFTTDESSLYNLDSQLCSTVLRAAAQQVSVVSIITSLHDHDYPSCLDVSFELTFIAIGNAKDRGFSLQLLQIVCLKC